MFDIGWSELVVIAVVALIAIGPKELPGVLRMVGQWMGKARKMASEFQGQFQEAMREAEMADLMRLVEEVAFRKLDQRLAALLLGKGRIVRATHQQLADELGSVREMVSRLLKGFAEQGLVTLGREQIEIRDAAGLRRIAEAV